MRRTCLLLTAVAMALLATPARAHDRDRDFDLPQAGVYIEGIGVDERAGVFYVSATNQTGRSTAGACRPAIASSRSGSRRRPATTAAGSRSTATAACSSPAARPPRSASSTAAARCSPSLPTGAAGSYLNDLWIGPDGAAYVTDSSLPVIWRVSNRFGHWRIDRFLDVSGTITYTPPLTDFDLGGITLTPTDATC